MAAPAYTVHEADPTLDREAILGVWRGNLGQDDRMPAKYDWFYLGCPWGPPLTMLLRHEESGEWVGVASAGPRRMLRDGTALRAGVLVDMAVLPAHRSLGPALMLQAALVQAASPRFDLLYGFPNPKAAPVFKRAGYAPLANIHRYARVLRHGGYLSRRLPAFLALPVGLLLDALDRLRLSRRAAGLACEWASRAGEACDALWRASDPDPGPVAIRDREFLEWRFDDSPLCEVRYLLVGREDGAAMGWFACEARGGNLHVVDFWTRGGSAGPDEAQLARLLLAARDAGHASVSVELGGAATGSAWGAAGFVARESRAVFGRATGTAAGPGDIIWLTSADEDE